MVNQRPGALPDRILRSCEMRLAERAWFAMFTENQVLGDVRRLARRMQSPRHSLSEQAAMCALSLSELSPQTLQQLGLLPLAADVVPCVESASDDQGLLVTAAEEAIA